MTSQFPAQPAAATRLLLVLDAPMDSDVADDLVALVATYGPQVIEAAEESPVASRLARGTGAPVQGDLGAGSGDAATLPLVRAMLEAHAGGCVAVVASDAAVRALLCESLGVPMGVSWRFQLEAGAVSVVELGPDGRWALVRFNERGGPAAQT